jgi:hypothetical protein
MIDHIKSILKFPFAHNSLPLKTKLFIANSELMKSLLKKIKHDLQLKHEIEKVITPYLKNDYKYYSDNFLFDNLKNQYQYLLNDIEKNIPKNQTIFTPGEVIEIVKKILTFEFKNISKWEIKIGHKYRLNHAKLVMHIGDRKMKYEKLKSIIFHELAVHFYRAQKSYILANKLNLNGYLVFEEGLAKMFETIGSDHENKAKFKHRSIILFLIDIGLNDKFIQQIFDILKYSQSTQNKLLKKRDQKYKLKFNSLIYIICFQKVQYFSTKFADSQMTNPLLYSAFLKITKILMEYKFNPLNYSHIKGLNSLNILNLNSEELNHYKKFTNSKSTKNIDQLSRGISEHRFSPNLELS